MRRDSPPVFRDVVLAGGGHSHALLIRLWGMQPLPGVRLTLISPAPYTPYSGMLPGLVAGHYTFDDIHIDLVRLCHWAGVRCITDSVTGIDTANNRVLLEHRPPLEFDVLSLDTGARPALTEAGVAAHAITVKPVAGFWQRWQEVRLSLRDNLAQHVIAVVGGGAGAVEIALAMARACQQDPAVKTMPVFHLFCDTENILPGYPARVRKAARNALAGYAVIVHASCSVTAVEASGVVVASGERFAADHVFWCTQAAAPEWPAKSGLACSDDGFVAVNAALQSISHPAIFAAGDIAHMVDSPLPKAGVYAVRQAPVLSRNINNALLGRPLEKYRPQKRFLSLLALGDKVATGSRGPFSVSGRWVWQWKHRIDTAFMRKFAQLPVMDTAGSRDQVPAVFVPPAERDEILDGSDRCAGCGAKVGPGVLAEAITAVGENRDPEDASIVTWPSSILVQSVDQLSAPFDDPWLFGRVAVLHAINDVLARNAVPHSIQVALSLPFAGRTSQRRELQALLAGVLAACRDESVRLLGGHTSEGPALTASITVNGLPGAATFNKQGARAGDVLMMNKALGTGIVLAAHMRGLASGRQLESTLASMAFSNRIAAEALSRAEVHACTDVSGFGLLGHLAEMLAETSLSPQLLLDDIPVLPGTMDLVRAGIRSSLSPQNAQRVLATAWGGNYRDCAHWPVLVDPQTSGSLLVSVDGASAGILREAGFHEIGRIA